MNFATCLTIIRILIAPLFLLIYTRHEALGLSAVILPYVLLLLMGVSELSDAFDGYVARRFNHVTDLGKLLDPMADSIARISVFLTFTQPPVSLPLLLVVVFLYRDSMVSTLRIVCALKGFALAARASGKLKAILQALAAFTILVLMIPHSLGMISTAVLQATSFWMVTLVGIYTVFSAADYFYSNRSYVHKFLAH